MLEASKPWDGVLVRKWLESRTLAARADQVAAERSGWGHHDDCDKGAAEEMVCGILNSDVATADQAAFSQALKGLLDRDEYIWRGVYDDVRFERHVRSYIRKLLKMAKTNAGFENSKRYQ